MSSFRSMRLQIATRQSRLPLVHDFAAGNGDEHPHILDALWRHVEDVVAEDDDVGELAARQRALLLLLELRERRAARVRTNRFGNRDLLFRNPAVGIAA